ncbi:MAG: hypothetical protein ACI9R3_004341 [Verrucomicrobiales bacterium]|jgi:hypothetical protein
MTSIVRIFLSLTLLPCVTALHAQQKQNPSPMVEHSRSHLRLEKSEPNGSRFPLRDGIVLFLPEGANELEAIDASLPLLVHCHGGHWLPQLAAVASGNIGCLSIQIGAGSGAYARLFEADGSFQALLSEAEKASKRRIGTITLSGWSAGCGAIREILRDQDNDAMLERVIVLDGIHTSYTNGVPGPQESEIETAKLAPFVRFARLAMRAHHHLLITHTTIFPGTFASTTETADWLLGELKLDRQAILRWGPMGTQILSEACAGNFLLLGFAGNSAPDHVDHLHALSELLKRPAQAK